MAFEMSRGKIDMSIGVSMQSLLHSVTYLGSIEGLQMPKKTEDGENLQQMVMSVVDMGHVLRNPTEQSEISPRPPRQ